MEAPDFPVPPGKYLVTGGRETTTELTITPDYKWSLGTPRGTRSDVTAKLYDVTHLPCRAAKYSGGSPASARQSDFPVTPGAPMPPVAGSKKQDYVRAPTAIAALVAAVCSCRVFGATTQLAS